MESAKQNILTRLRKALTQKTEKPYLSESDGFSGIFVPQQDYWEVIFAENLKRQGGTFFYCDDTEAMVGELAQLAAQRRWKNVHCHEDTLLEIFDICQFSLPKNTQPEQLDAVGITTCHGLIARTGSVLVSSQQAGGRTLSLLPQVHIVVATIRQLFYDLEDALHKIKNHLPATLSIITGPSRTADIEKTLVLGAHAPKELFVFLLEN